MNGALVFEGTRVPIEILVQHLAARDTLDKFLDDFPSVSREQAVTYLEMTLNDALELVPHDAQIAEDMHSCEFSSMRSFLGS